MIHATIRQDPYPAGKTVIVDALPKEGEIIKVEAWGKMKVQMIADRWGKPYVCLVSIYGHPMRAPSVEGYLEVKE